MSWLKSQKWLVALDYFIELFKILFAILIMYGALIDEHFGVLGKIGLVLTGFAGFAVSQYLKNNSRVILNKLTSPTLLPIEYGTVVPDDVGDILEIKRLFIKDNIVTVKFSVLDDKPFYILLQIIPGIDGKGQLDGSSTITDIPITPKWKGQEFLRQYVNLDNLGLNEEELTKERELVVKISYFSYFSIAEGLNDSEFRTFIRSGNFKEAGMHQYRSLRFKGSFLKKKFTIVG